MKNKTKDYSNILKMSNSDIINDIIQNKYIKGLKTGVIVIGAIYTLGHVLGILAFTNSKFQLLRKTFNQN